MTIDLGRLTSLATNLRSVTPASRSNTKQWFDMQNKGGDETVIGIYDEIGEWGVTAADFISQLNGIKTSKLTVQIASNGGSVDQGLAIYAALASHPAEVTTDVISHAYSAASYIAQAASPGKRRIRKNAKTMVHDPAIGGGVVYGNARQLRAAKDVLEEIAVRLDEAADNIASIYAEASGNNDIAYWRGLMEAETFLSADDTLSNGLADEIVGADGSPTKVTNKATTAPTNNLSTPGIENFEGLLSSLKGVFQ
jgi:ATP-dependent protease ClpP protease subunit